MISLSVATSRIEYCYLSTPVYTRRFQKYRKAAISWRQREDRRLGPPIAQTSYYCIIAKKVSLVFHRMHNFMMSAAYVLAEIMAAIGGLRDDLTLDPKNLRPFQYF